jgi:hypothetical protein
LAICAERGGPHCHKLEGLCGVGLLGGRLVEGTGGEQISHKTQR